MAFSQFLDSNFDNSDVRDNIFLVTESLQSSREDLHIFSISLNMKFFGHFIWDSINV